MTDPPSSSTAPCVVVTGGAGFIGSHLTDLLIEQGARVVVVDNLATGQRARVNAAATFIELDVTDTDGLKRLVAEHGPFGTWFHLAAQADVRVSVTDPLADARTNVLGTLAVLEAARIDGAGIVFSSTGGAIYGDAAIPTDESARERPESPYGAAKLAAEKYIEMHARLYGLPHAIVRFANVYGPRQDPHGEAGVVAIFGGRLLGDEPVTIYGDGSQTRDYVYVGDVVDATRRAADAGRRDGGDVPIFNVGTGAETSVNDLLRTMAERAGTVLGRDGLDADATHADPRTGELARSALDATRARRELGASFDTPLGDGLQRTLEWMRGQG